ncbi:hypothetical protein DNF23_32575 [Pseudomonas syringae pv. pisi]
MTNKEAITRASKRIANITGANSSDEVTFRFGIAVGFINAAREFNAVDEVVWAGLLESAEHANDNHPLVSVKSGDSSEL